MKRPPPSITEQKGPKIIGYLSRPVLILAFSQPPEIRVSKFGFRKELFFIGAQTTELHRQNKKSIYNLLEG